jgi:Mn2+/Fe2+ NRAMP family transporter
VLKGIFIPSIPAYINPDGKEQGVVWTLALMGGVGGTLTILSYGYWIREKGRNDREFLKTCQFDLAAAYFVTALFGMAMVVIASQINLDQGSSAKLVVNLAAKLKEIIGNTGSILFMLGAWAAVFSSLLGVWQSVPYMFTDFFNTFKRSNNTTPPTPDKVGIRWAGIQQSNHEIVNTKGLPYRVYLLAIAFVPMIGLGYQFVVIQKIYAVLGSLVIPFISLALLLLNRDKTLGDYKNKILTDVLLVSIVGLFIYLAFL